MSERNVEINKIIPEKASDIRLILKDVKQEIESYKKRSQQFQRDTSYTVLKDESLNLQNQKEPFREIYQHETHPKIIADDALRKLNSQTSVRPEDKDVITSPWKSSQLTKQNAEAELLEYKKSFRETNQNIKNKYENGISLLERVIETLKSKIREQMNLNKSLNDKNLQLEQNLVKSEHLCSELSTKEKKLLQQLETTANNLSHANQEIDQLRISLKNLQAYSQQNIKRETDVLNKMKETLNIAEISLKDKEDALNREREIRDDCNHLASTIAQVMDEAADKVDREMTEQKLKYQEKITSLESDIAKLKVALKSEQVQTSNADCRSRNIEEKLKSLVATNELMDRDLQIASKTIIEMELKLNICEKLVSKEQMTNKLYDQRSNNLQKYFHSNQRLKERWKETIYNITTILQGEIKILKKNNQILVMENELLKREQSVNEG